jgi:predicted MFS family arabinose efflux permease
MVSAGIGVIPSFANNMMTRAVLGLFIGAVLVRYASYHWVFWFVAIVAFPVALCCLFMIPPEIAKSKNQPETRKAEWESLDPIGILILTGVPHLIFMK